MLHGGHGGGTGHSGGHSGYGTGGGHGHGMTLGQLFGHHNGHGFVSGGHHQQGHGTGKNGGHADQSPMWSMVMQGEKFVDNLMRIQVGPALGMFVLFTGLILWLGVVRWIHHKEEPPAIVTQQEWSQALTADRARASQDQRQGQSVAGTSSQGQYSSATNTYPGYLPSQNSQVSGINTNASQGAPAQPPLSYQTARGYGGATYQSYSYPQSTAPQSLGTYQYNQYSQSSPSAQAGLMPGSLTDSTSASGYSGRQRQRIVINR